MTLDEIIQETGSFLYYLLNFFYHIQKKHKTKSQLILCYAVITRKITTLKYL